MYQATKTYPHELGLSACFRQHKAKSHCRLLHGYPLSFKLTFEADELDENNWVIDFGGLKPVKAWLEETFDHKLVIGEDDPQRLRLESLGTPAIEMVSAMILDHDPIADVLVIPFVGCEGFSRYVASYVQSWLWDMGHAPRVRLVSVECREHGGNSALYFPEKNK